MTVLDSKILIYLTTDGIQEVCTGSWNVKTFSKPVLNLMSDAYENWKKNNKLEETFI